MAFDTVKWLKEDMGFTEEEQKTLAALITPERATVLEKGYLRQSDYSKHMDALTAAQTKLAEENERLTEEMAQWATVQASGGELTKKQQQELNAAEQRVLRAQQKIREIAARAGVDAEATIKEVMGEAPVTTTTTAATAATMAALDTSQFLTAEHQQRLAMLSLDLATIVPAIAEEHFALTGERLDPRLIRNEIVARAGTKGNKKSTAFETVWTEMYDIPAKREAKAKERHDTEIAAAEQRGREAAMSEAALPGHGHTHGDRPHSTVMTKFAGPDHRPAAQRPATQQTVSNAAAAFRSGKYRTPDAGKSGATA